MEVTYEQPVMREVMEATTQTLDEFSDSIAWHVQDCWRSELYCPFAYDPTLPIAKLFDAVKEEVIYQVTESVRDGVWEADDLPEFHIREQAEEHGILFLAEKYNTPRAMELAIPILSDWGWDDLVEDYESKLYDLRNQD